MGVTPEATLYDANVERWFGTAEQVQEFAFPDAGAFFLYQLGIPPLTSGAPLFSSTIVIMEAGWGVAILSARDYAAARQQILQSSRPGGLMALLRPSI